MDINDDVEEMAEKFGIEGAGGSNRTHVSYYHNDNPDGGPGFATGPPSNNTPTAATGF
jgi:hypothetical protein